GPPHACEQVGVGEAARGDGVLEGAGRVLLPDQLLEGLGSPLPGEHLIHVSPDGWGAGHPAGVRPSMMGPKWTWGTWGDPLTVAPFRAGRGSRGRSAQDSGPARGAGRRGLAERVGFEPTVRFPAH